MAISSNPLTSVKLKRPWMFNFEELLSIPNILTIQLSSIKTDLQKKFDVEGSLQKKGFLSLLGVRPPPSPLFFGCYTIYLFIYSALLEKNIFCP